MNNNIAKQSVGPILSDIINSFSKFKAECTKIGNNYLVCPIYCNEAFGIGRDLIEKLDDDFFGINGTTPVQTVHRIQTVTWSDLTMNNNIMTKVMVEASLGHEITPEIYLKLKTAYNIATKKYRKEGEKAVSIDIFFRSFKKGSKKFRKVLSAVKGKYRKPRGCEIRPVKKFLELIDCQRPIDVRIKSLFFSWDKYFLLSRLKTFKFKYYNNVLGLNARVAHFNNTVSAECTFCNIAGPHPAPAESLSHIFYYCPVTSNMLRRVFNLYYSGVDITREKYFLGHVSEQEKENIVATIFFEVVRHLLWESKLAKKIPTVSCFLDNLRYEINLITNCSRKISDLFSNSNTLNIAGNGRAVGDVRRP